MTTHVMIDLETMGTAPGSAIISIGAVKFIPETGEIGPETFYRNISLTSCLLAGLTIDAGTLAWWRDQSSEAKLALDDGGCTSLRAALAEFAQYLTSNAHGEDTGTPVVWCKGADFDFPLLAAAYRALDIPLPWKFWNARCARTLFNVCRDQFGYVLPKVQGTAHNALDDARHQAEQVAACLQLMCHGKDLEAQPA